MLSTDGLVEHAGDLVAGLRDLRHRASCLGGRPLALGRPACSNEARAP
ncbi:hypothetical protein [Aciditerrimonas ferrireducens]|nr:hypothetical protein [Aciditerrimonas ferrireducens]MCK4177415.1 hypothetical protein [Aciditerrimonas ferrireducens]